MDSPWPPSRRTLKLPRLHAGPRTKLHCSGGVPKYVRFDERLNPAVDTRFAKRNSGRYPARMNAPHAVEDAALPQTKITLSTVSRIIRRVHMYTGLFLAPWMLMYALSTLVMTHREYILSYYPSKNPAMVTERELDYTRSFPAATTREQIGLRILQDLGLDGTHSVSGGRNGKPLVINRQHALRTQRVTFDATTRKILIQREEFRAATFLDRLHRRRGYNQPYTLEDTWGFTVDVAVVTMVFWCLSGIWLWWEIKPVRRWGALALAAGVSLFGIFAALI